jgi:peroxiredoxin
MIQYVLSRRIAAGTALLALSAGVYAQDTFTIEGRLAGDSNGMVKLSYFNGRREVEDSAQISGGRFTFKGLTDVPVPAKLLRNPVYGTIYYEDYIKQDAQEFYLAPGTNTVSSKKGLKTAIIANSGAQKDYLLLQQQHQQADDKIMALNAEGQRLYDAKNDTGVQRVRKSLHEVELQRVAEDNRFIQQHPDSYVAFDVLEMRCLTQPVNLSADTALFNQFSERIRTSRKGKKLQAFLNTAKKLVPGRQAPDFTLLDTTGQPVSLSAFRGRYVLLCFWMPQMVGSYAGAIQQLAKQGQGNDVSIVSVAYAPEWDYWLSILKRKQLPGTHLVDLNGINAQNNPSETARAYGLNIGSFPQCYLLNKEGVIIARHLAFDTSLQQHIQQLIR